MPPLFEELAKEIEGDCTGDVTVTTSLSTDNSPFSIRPQAAVYPKTIEDIKKIVLFGKRYSIPITVRGLGQGSRGGSLTDGLLVDMSRYFDKMEQPKIVHNTISIQAGVNYKDCVGRLQAWGYTLPFGDDIPYDMTLGGMFASGYRGGPSLFHGGMPEWVESLRVVLDDGNEYLIANHIAPTGRLLEIYKDTLHHIKQEAHVYRTRRPRVANHTMGYDVFTSHISPKLLLHLLLGSQGTLGIITEITVRLSIMQKKRVGIALRVNLLHDLAKKKQLLLETNPLAIYGFDTKAYDYAQKMHTNAFLEKHNKDAFTLFALYDNERDLASVEAHYKKLSVPLEEKIFLPPELTKEYLRIVYQQKKALESYSGNTLHAISLFDDIVVPQENYTEVFRECTSLCEEFGLLYSVTGDVGNGAISIIPLINLSNKDSADTIIALLTRSAHIVKTYHGSMSFKESDGITTTPLLSFLYGAEISKRMRDIKTIWDKNNIFNPGKKTTIDFSYLKRYLR